MAAVTSCENTLYGFRVVYSIINGLVSSLSRFETGQLIRSFSSYDGDSGKNVLLQTSSFLFQFVQLAIFWRIPLDWNYKRLYLSSEKEK